ncbi:hypothetical protein [Selenomonas noxia]|uniref:hypothetical protein n=1 Tax=Selenomonas noxia TaxID=135083 RepID=UPI002048152F|nr:hypothetical protein [Selenomonas noxia]DAS96864.1 MAG TPA: replication protein O [Caudoviricetes sp.]
MDYIRQLNTFLTMSAGNLPGTPFTVYMRLFQIANMRGWPECFPASDAEICLMTGIRNKKTIAEARRVLEQAGYIKTIRGGKHQATQYQLVELGIAPVIGNPNTPITTPIDGAITTPIDGAITTPITGHYIKHKRKTETETKKEKQKEKAGTFPLEDYTDNAELLEALRGFVEMRKKIKAPLTEHAFSLLFKKLDGMGSTDEEKAAIVNQSVMNSWKGLFPLKQEVRQSGAHISHSKDALDERYPDFAAANRNYVPPWEVRPAGGGDRAASG